MAKKKYEVSNLRNVIAFRDANFPNLYLLKALT